MDVNTNYLVLDITSVLLLQVLRDGRDDVAHEQADRQDRRPIAVQRRGRVCVLAADSTGFFDTRDRLTGSPRD